MVNLCQDANLASGALVSRHGTKCWSAIPTDSLLNPLGYTNYWSRRALFQEEWKWGFKCLTTLMTCSSMIVAEGLEEAVLEGSLGECWWHPNRLGIRTGEKRPGWRNRGWRLGANGNPIPECDLPLRFDSHLSRRKYVRALVYKLNGFHCIDSPIYPRC